MILLAFIVSCIACYNASPSIDGRWVYSNIVVTTTCGHWPVVAGLRALRDISGYLIATILCHATYLRMCVYVCMCGCM